MQYNECRLYFSWMIFDGRKTFPFDQEKLLSSIKKKKINLPPHKKLSEKFRNYLSLSGKSYLKSNDFE